MNLRCPVCGGGRITAPTALHLADGNIQLRYEQNRQGGIVAGGVRYFGPPLGCACADCGYVMLFLDAQTLARLRSEIVGT